MYIGSTGIQAGSLRFGATGKLFAGGTGPNTGNVYSINVATGAATLVGNTGFGSVTGLAFVVPPAPVPTVSTWSLLALIGAILLFGVGLQRLRLRR